MLSEISEVIGKEDIGLYRDDGLGIMRQVGGPEIERRKKNSFFHVGGMILGQ